MVSRGRCCQGKIGAHNTGDIVGSCALCCTICCSGWPCFGNWPFMSLFGVSVKSVGGFLGGWPVGVPWLRSLVIR